MKINYEVIARTSLRLLNEVGLDGLTMRLVAKELDVQAPALYWHVRNKQELLDAMAGIMLAEVVEGLEPPAPGFSWPDWLGGSVRRLRRVMLGYRDGARVLAGTNVTHPAVFQMMELTLRAMLDAGFPPDETARDFPVLLHYTVGYTIEEQARGGASYDGDNPYRPERLAERLDPRRFPLVAGVLDDLFDPDADAGFERGLHIILSGMRVTRSGH
ncbi:TetR/AcrR family transcriptional regulator C-terminal domain-containing protein [Streptosporangium sp. CA-135522]|uniref:TetR/AcrR family transcriptional regulator C-terminal domain-containing protein n=1 Tax=Streptosporangium sp. CA-135522 TaxID=3240072 RepID=UPI003D8C68E3